MRTKELVALDKAELEVIKKKFCTSCRWHKPLEGGVLKQTRKAKLWRCASCWKNSQK